MAEPLDDKRETSLRDFLSVLFRRKWIVLAVFLATTAAVVAADTLSPTRYQSASQVLVSRGEPESAYSGRTRVLLTLEEELNSELETIKSTHILQMAQGILDEAGARDSRGAPVKIGAAEVSATTVPHSSIIYINVKSQDPRTAQEVARAVTQAYTSFRLNVRSVPELDAFFREQIDEVRGQLDDWEQRRADFMNTESVSRIPDERSSIIEVRKQTELELNDIHTGIAGEQAKVDVLERLLQSHDQDPRSEIYGFSESDNNDDQIILQIKKELVAKRSAWYAARGQYQDEYPEVKSLKGQVDQLDSLLVTEVRNYVRHLKGKVEVLRAREEALQSALAYSDAEISSFPSKEAKLAAFDRVIEALTSDYRALTDKQIQARLERIGTPDWNVLVLQPATESERLRTSDAVRLALIPLFGLIGAMALAFMVDGLDHSVKDATEAERHLGLPVLGSVGRLR